MSDPHDIAADLRHAADALWRTTEGHEYNHKSRACDGCDLVVRIRNLADSFEQPGDGPLAYDPDTGRMVRLEPVEHIHEPGIGAMPVTQALWRFPSRVTSEGAGT